MANQPPQAKFKVSDLSGDDIATLIDLINVHITTHQVTELHRKSDTNLRPDSIHHTLGGRAVQGSPGDHTHDGGTSAQLVATTISGSKTTSLATLAAVVGSLIDSLAAIGITNATT